MISFLIEENKSYEPPNVIITYCKEGEKTNSILALIMLQDLVDSIKKITEADGEIKKIRLCNYTTVVTIET